MTLMILLNLYPTDHDLIIPSNLVLVCIYLSPLLKRKIKGEDNRKSFLLPTVYKILTSSRLKLQYSYRSRIKAANESQ